MIINSVSDWFQFVSLQLLSDTIEHTLHSVGVACTFNIEIIHVPSILETHKVATQEKDIFCTLCV